MCPTKHRSWLQTAFCITLLAVAAACGGHVSLSDGAARSEATIANGAIASQSWSNTDTTVTYAMNFTGTTKFRRVYIDADQDPTTGYPVGGIGADYMIENSHLDNYAGNGTTFVFPQSTTPISYTLSPNTTTPTSVTWTVPRSGFSQTNICSELANLLFDIDDTSNVNVTQNFTPAASCSTTSSSSGGSTGGGGSGGGLSHFVVSNDSQNIYYQYTYSGTPSLWHVYIDADNNAGTGFAAGPGVGADYMVEGDTAYQSPGTPAWGWNSPPLGTVIFTNDTTTKVAQWTVSRSLIKETGCGLTNALLFQTQDAAGNLTSSGKYTEVFNDACGASGSSGGSTGTPPPPPASPIKYVFVITMENEAASSIYGSSAAPYINGTIIPNGSHSTDFNDPLADADPSEPHYVWMEAGTNVFSDVSFLTDDDASASNSTASTAHLSTQLTAAGISWKSYQENISEACPIGSSGFFAAKHDPFVFFKDVSGNPPSASNTFCAAHHQAYTTSSFASALSNKTVAQYNFITPNLCNDMHGATGCPSTNEVTQGDTWLANNLPPILSFANANSGVIFIIWDEPEGGSTLIPFLAIGPQIKANYASPTSVTHSALPKTVEEIFDLPQLATVKSANDFGDMFKSGSVP